MAKQQEYLVLHPVRYNGKLYPRGTKVGPDEKTALRFLELGVISTNAVAVVVVATGPSTAESLASFTQLNSMNKDDLAAYGKTTYGLTLDAAAKKETLVAAIHEQYVARFVAAPSELDPASTDTLTAELAGAGIGARV